MKTSKKNYNTQKNPCDIFTNNEIENISKMFTYYNFIELLEKIYQDAFRANSWCSCSFINNTTTHEEPENKNFDKNSSKAIQQNSEDIKENNSKIDFIKDNDQITITIEMLDIKEEEIDIKATKKSIELFPNNPVGKYHKSFDLPYMVKPNTLTFTFRNGILDIVIKRDGQD